MWIPRYVSEEEAQGKEKLHLRVATVSESKLIFKAVDLDQFILWLDNLPYSDMMDIRLGSEMWGDVIYKSRSSAKAEHLIWDPRIEKPRTASSFLMACIKCSITITYRIGERGQPCLVPFRITKEPERDPFTRIWAEGRVYSGCNFPLLYRGN